MENQQQILFTDTLENSTLYTWVFCSLHIFCSQLNIVVQVNQWLGCGVIIVSTMGLQLLHILLL